jgi:nitroreductase
MLTTINTRRSVRRWTDAPVPESDLRDILEAGMNAPSAGNEQAWQFVVLDDRQTMEAYAALNPNVTFLGKAPAAILVCADTGRERYPGYGLQDCCAATENILLAIHAKGLGGVWGAVFPQAIPGIRDLLGLPASLTPIAVVPFGAPRGARPDAHSRYDAARVHKNRYQA